MINYLGKKQSTCKTAILNTHIFLMIRCGIISNNAIIKAALVVVFVVVVVGGLSAIILVTILYNEPDICI